MPMTIEIPEPIAQKIHQALELSNCKDEQEFVLKAVTTQLKSVKKQSNSAIQIREWLKEVGWDEIKVLKDFEGHKKGDTLEVPERKCRDSNRNVKRGYYKPEK